VAFGVGTDHRIYQARFASDGTLLSGWTLAAPGVFDSVVVGNYGADGSVVVFGIATAGVAGQRVFAARFDNQANLINGWFQFAPGAFAKLAVGVYDSGSPELFGIGVNQQVYGARFNAEANLLNGWFPVAPGAFTDIAVASRTDGSLELFGISLGQVFASNFDTSGNFVSGWFTANSGQPVNFTQLAAATLGNGNAIAFGLGTDQLVYDATFDSITGVQASGWTSLSSNLYSRIAAGSQIGITKLYAIAALDDQIFAELFDSSGAVQTSFFLTAPGQFVDLGVSP
jgi:hypothetical protein